MTICFNQFDLYPYLIELWYLLTVELASRSGRASGPVSDQSPLSLKRLTGGGESLSLFALADFSLLRGDVFKFFFNSTFVLSYKHSNDNM